MEEPVHLARHPKGRVAHKKGLSTELKKRLFQPDSCSSAILPVRLAIRHAWDGDKFRQGMHHRVFVGKNHEIQTTDE